MENFKNNRWLTILTILLLTANIVTLVLLWKQRNIAHSPAFAEQMPAFEFIIRELKLNSSQQATYMQLVKEHREGQKSFQDNIRLAKDSFFSLLQNNTADALLKTESNKVANAIGELELYNYKHFQKLRAICNAEQQKKFDSIIKDILHRMAQPRRSQELPPPPDGFNMQPPHPPGERICRRQDKFI
ncbi:MAG: hypothetical protein IPP48_12520 [Chitinophagaceae bacterium]|nr:hypothetical protein [Chitinophagaceae bacterium]